MPRPNILFIIADDHRHDAIRACGDASVQTPVLDGLIGRGACLRRNYMMGGLSGAVCVPARAALHTGCNPFRASRRLDDYRGMMELDPALKTLPETLRRGGYRTFATGKWHNDRASFARSFCRAARIFFGGMSAHTAVPLHDFDPEGRYAGEDQYSGEGFSSELFAEAAIEFLEGYRSGDPFFLYLAFTAPHDPRTPPEEYAKLYDPAHIPLPANFAPEHPFDNGELRVRDEELAAFPRTGEEVRRHLADYYGMLSHMDAQIGRVLEALEASGYGRDTIVVYTADHGLALGQHGLLGKQNLYEHSVRVPLVLAGPGLPRGKAIHALSFTYDLYPTLCALAGIETPDAVEARSLLPLLRGEAEHLRASVYALYRDVQRMVCDGRWKMIRYYRAAERGAGEERLQLFDTREDPHELRDLSGDAAQRPRLERLAAELCDWQERVGDPLASRPVLV